MKEDTKYTSTMINVLVLPIRLLIKVEQGEQNISRVHEKLEWVTNSVYIQQFNITTNK